MDLLFLLCALLLGFFLAWFLLSRKQAKLLNAKSEAEKQQAVAEEKLSAITKEMEQTKENLHTQTASSNSKALELERQSVQNSNLQERLSTQKKEIEELQKKLTSEFENIASKILKARSDEFSASNQKNLGEVLNPLKERIRDFEKKVDEAYDKELRDKLSLREEVRKLSELNSRISEEANNLTKALKGDVKKQGNWGEIVLERVLEHSGLTLGREYEREQVIEGSNNETYRPDVIIHLPDNKHIIIDSKVSLIAYERMISENDEKERNRELKEHISSLRSHVKQLSEKNYQNAKNINTPDFVLMFVPIEASFSFAVQADAELFAFAWQKKIVIVSPTTLLATLRTISSIWKQENQTKNAQEIARLSGVLYDKFIGFSEDLNKIKISLDRASTSYDDAVRKMKTGQGNIIRTAERIKELGAKTGNKTLPKAFDEISE